jgi:hypothetical protein
MAGVATAPVGGNLELCAADASAAVTRNATIVRGSISGYRPRIARRVQSTNVNSQSIPHDHIDHHESANAAALP